MLVDKKKDFQPLFLSGYSRSGTTLLLSLLDGHPDLCVFPEETLFRKHTSPAFNLANFSSDEDFANYWYENSLIHLMFQNNSEKNSQEVVGGGGITTYETLDKAKFTDLFLKYFQSSSKEMPDRFESLLLAYNEYIQGGDVKYYVEKQPANQSRLFGYLKMWEGTKSIFMLRHPLAAITSNVQKNRPGRQKLDDYEFLFNLRKWLNSLFTIYRFANVYPDKVLIVKYEDLISNREYEMKRVSDFLSIPFHENLLIPTKMNQKWKGVSSTLNHENINYQKNNDRWTEILTQEQISLANLLVGQTVFNIGLPPILSRYKKDVNLKQTSIKNSLIQAYKYLPFDLWRLFTRLLFFSGFNFSSLVKRQKYEKSHKED